MQNRCLIDACTLLAGGYIIYLRYHIKCRHTVLTVANFTES